MKQIEDEEEMANGPVDSHIIDNNQIVPQLEK